MMRRYLLRLLFPCLAAVSSGAQCVPGGDVYAHFVGDWSGRNQYELKGQWIDAAVAIHITELKDCRGIRLQYTYGDGVNQPIKHAARLITLNPSAEQMTSRFHVMETEYYETAGLREFAKTGMGVFAARARGLEQGMPVAHVGEFHLSETAFSYSWKRFEDGQPPKLVGSFTLQRTGASPGAGAGP